MSAHSGNRSDLRRRIALICASLLWMAMIFWMSARDAEESGALSGNLLEKIFALFTPRWEQFSAAERLAKIERFHTLFRKLGHFTEYAVLGILYALTLRSMRKRGQKRRLRETGLSAILALVYAATDELHQRYVPGRSCELRDICIDFAGACTGLLLLYAVLYFVDRHRSKEQSNSP